jgi:hypothetical protein
VKPCMLFMQLGGSFCRLIAKKIAIMRCAMRPADSQNRVFGARDFGGRERNLDEFAGLNDLGEATARVIPSKHGVPAVNPIGAAQRIRQ